MNRAVLRLGLTGAGRGVRGGWGLTRPEALGIVRRACEFGFTETLNIQQDDKGHPVQLTSCDQHLPGLPGRIMGSPSALARWHLLCVFTSHWQRQIPFPSFAGGA